MTEKIDLKKSLDCSRARLGRFRIVEVRFQTLSEGRCVQTMHIGAFDDEGEELRRMHRECIPEHALRMAGRHHEI